MFYAKKEVREKRLEICRSCEHYLSLLGNCKLCGCFMRVKTSIASMRCADKDNRRWERVGHEEVIREAPEFREEVIEVFEILKKPGGYKIDDIKQRAITLHNTIYGSNFNTNTNCGSCTQKVYQGLERLYNEYV